MNKCVAINEITSKNTIIFTSPKSSIEQSVGRILRIQPEKRTIQTEIEERQGTEFLRIDVTDTGIGIPANRLPYITQPFEQVACQYSRDHEGSGLGLAITKELVELHMGSLHIDSQVGQGTIVSVRLPYDVHKERVRQSERDEAESVRQYA